MNPEAFWDIPCIGYCVYSSNRRGMLPGTVNGHSWNTSYSSIPWVIHDFNCGHGSVTTFEKRICSKVLTSSFPSEEPRNCKCKRDVFLWKALHMIFRSEYSWMALFTSWNLWSPFTSHTLLLPVQCRLLRDVDEKYGQIQFSFSFSWQSWCMKRATGDLNLSHIPHSSTADQEDSSFSHAVLQVRKPPDLHLTFFEGWKWGRKIFRKGFDF